MADIAGDWETHTPTARQRGDAIAFTGLAAILSGYGDGFKLRLSGIPMHDHWARYRDRMIQARAIGTGPNCHRSELSPSPSQMTRYYWEVTKLSDLIQGPEKSKWIALALGGSARRWVGWDGDRLLLAPQSMGDPKLSSDCSTVGWTVEATFIMTNEAAVREVLAECDEAARSSAPSRTRRRRRALLQIVANRIMATRMKSSPRRSKSVPRLKPSGTVALIATTSPSSCWSFTWTNGTQWPVSPRSDWRAASTSPRIILAGKASRSSRSFVNLSDRMLWKRS